MNLKITALVISIASASAAAPLFGAAACCATPSEGTSSAAAPSVSPNRLLLTSYERMAKALANDDLRAAQKDGRTFATVCEFVCQSPDSEAMKNCGESVKAFLEATDIEKARELFKAISADVIKLARQEEGYFVMTCSMAGENADWVQSTREVRNPYHGSRMLRCGSVKPEQEAAAAAPRAEG